MRSVRLLAVVLTLATAFTAAAENKDAARKAFQDGKRYYNLYQYVEALDAFKRAYWNYEEPTFLYNIAQCHRALKHKSEAIEFYRSYLRNAPDAPNRVEVERIIAELDASLQQDRALAHAPPDGTITAPPVTSPPPTTSPAPTTLVTSAPPPRADKPVWKKAWFWGVVGGAAVVVAGVAIGVGIATSTPKDPSASLGARPVN